jgi:hypothetical protein
MPPIFTKRLALPGAQVLLVSLLLCAQAFAQQPCPGGSGIVDSERLPELLAERGYVADKSFKALVVEVVELKEGGHCYRYFDFNGTANDRENWWPASNIKIFAAVGALVKLSEWGFGPKAILHFAYTTSKLWSRDELPQKDRKRAKELKHRARLKKKGKWKPLEDVEITVSRLLRKAITHSDNRSYDRLVELADYEWLNDVLLADRYNLGRTTLQRSYGGRVRYADSWRGSLRHAAPLTVTHKKNKKVRTESRSDRAYDDCPKQGNCTTLLNLTEVMRRVMMHESLAEAQRFAISPENLDLLRQALAGKRERGLGVVNGLKQVFGAENVKIYHKPGFAMKWFSDVVFVDHPADGRKWLVAMAAHGGRNVLDEASVLVAELMKSGALTRPISVPEGP